MLIMGMFGWIVDWFKAIPTDLSNKALAEFKSKAAQYLTEVDGMLSKESRKGMMDKLRKERGWSEEDVDKANKCIEAFKGLKKEMVDEASGEKKGYNFNFIEGETLEKYKELCRRLNDLQRASANHVFENTTREVISLLNEFCSVCLKAIVELNEFEKKDFNEEDVNEKYKKILSNLNRQELGAATKVSGLFKGYIYQKSIMSAADVAKFYFAACSISSKKDQQIGFLGRGLSNTLLYAQNELQETRDKLLKKAKERRAKEKEKEPNG